MQKMMLTVIASLMLAACGGQAKESAQAESSGPHGPATVTWSVRWLSGLASLTPMRTARRETGLLPNCAATVLR